ncbi:cytotoxic translational repressor of toxin-antitoxin stability system [Nitratidesulfovibrio sp. 1201_IL3209]|uniref:cytotoxic translational repressor of toxin-antitoxin stability system n=1 Tax=Nitratidesulfovibrio sp. 1201_IL3209 TaxID=3084053 RepID=UPI002FD93609
MNWIVTISAKAAKGIAKLPQRVQDAVAALIADIRAAGPVRGDWPNYSKLGDDRHHCHLKKGRPAYVAVWEEKDKKAKEVEVTYAGTHEKAPY